MPVPYKQVLYSVADRIARITLNAPEKRNALSFPMRDEIVKALRTAEADDDVSVVHSAYFEGWTDQFARSCLRDLLTIWDLLKPVIVKAHGHCVAGGTEILSMADIAFVTEDARIGYPPMRGMTTPDTLYFPWKMSMARAKYLQLKGNSVTGREAAQMGWVAKCFPADRLEDEVMRELRPMTQIAPDLLAANKQSVNQACEITGFRTALSVGWQWHALSSRLRPGASQFAEKMREGGLKTALEWRDGPFRREGFD